MKTGVLLTNLGTPEAPSAPAVRRYLRQFLSDRRVVQLPRVLWLPILYGFILPFRPRRLAHAYASIWTEHGSPLLAISRQQRAALQDSLGNGTPVVLAMTYGQPSIQAGLHELRQSGVARIVVLPLYPQYSHTTTAAVRDALEAGLQQMNWQPGIRFIDDYHADRGYIDALAASVRGHRAAGEGGDHLLISFHSIPQSYVAAGDPYQRQCEATGALLARALGLADGQWSISYQSRLGRQPWLQPYTDLVLPQLAARGIGAIDVICPGFSADCLETLEEVSIRYRELFLQSGGRRFSYVPALNSRADHIAALRAVAEAARAA